MRLVATQAIDDLLTEALGDTATSPKARKELAKVFDLDPINLIYFLILGRQKKHPQAREKLRLFDESEKNFKIPDGVSLAYPTATAPPELLEKIPFCTYDELRKKSSHYEALGSTCALWLKKTQAGGGTSIIRDEYLRRIRHESGPVSLGAKGTDLFVEPGLGEKPISLASIQIKQALADLEHGQFAQIFYHDIVSGESQRAVHEIWDSLKINDKKFTRFGETFQAVLPTFDDQGRLSSSRKAPGGHAFFAVETLLSIAHENNIPKTPQPLVCVIGNGEDLGSTPDPAMIGWMIEENIPIAMVTTEKTEIDLKGGQIAIVEPHSGLEYIALIEQAQAKEAGQLKLFEDLGLTVKARGQISFFNTNVALFNVGLLKTKLSALLKKIGEAAFLKSITPTLIENKKVRNDDDGTARIYEQLEGAMGSTLLNLDHAWRVEFGEALVHFINVERGDRTRFFSPIKTAFDFFMQFHSDRFSLDRKTWRLSNHKPGRLPLVSLKAKGDFYNEVQTVLNCFENTEIADLDSLFVDGPVILKNMRLRGDIRITNESNEIFDLTEWFSQNGRLAEIDGKTISISTKREVKIANARSKI